MRQRAASREESKSLRTFALYAGIVFLLIAVSLSIKAFFIFQKSKFDGRHHVTIALARDGKVAEVVSFAPSSSSYYLMKLQQEQLPMASLSKDLGIVPDGTIEAKGSTIPFGENVADTLFQGALRYSTVKTDLTIFDMVRLGLLAKGTPENNKLTKEIKTLDQSGDIDKIIASYFTDDALSAEGINIHIINATDAPGVGKRLERILSNIGANVVRVTSAEKIEKKSKIQYVGEETYTLKKLQKLLKFPVSQLEKTGIADIVVVIGEDNASRF